MKNMRKTALLVLICLALFAGRAPAQSKPDDLKYVLVDAKLNTASPLTNWVAIEFGESFPKKYLTIPVDPGTPPGIYSMEVKTSDWLIESTELSSGKRNVVKVEAMRVVSQLGNEVVYLKIANPPADIDPTTHKVRVT